MALPFYREGPAQVLAGQCLQCCRGMDFTKYMNQIPILAEGRIRAGSAGVRTDSLRNRAEAHN